MTSSRNRLFFAVLSASALTLASCVVASQAQAQGLRVVSGDANIASSLVGNGTSVNAGNQRFFTNVLGTGRSVLVQGNDSGGSTTTVTDINTFYNTVSGVTSTVQSGTITAASLSGINLFVSALPQNAFSASETTALVNFSNSGGSVFLIGDAASFSPTQDANLNALLTSFSSALRIVPANQDAGFMTATGSRISSSTLTAGVTSLSYAYTSLVSGGTSLVTTTGGSTFLAAENIAGAAAPEPGSIALLALSGLPVIGMIARRRRKVAQAAPTAA